MFYLLLPTRVLCQIQSENWFYFSGSSLGLCRSPPITNVWSINRGSLSNFLSCPLPALPSSLLHFFIYRGTHSVQGYTQHFCFRIDMRLLFFFHELNVYIFHIWGTCLFLRQHEVCNINVLFLFYFHCNFIFSPAVISSHPHHYSMLHNIYPSDGKKGGKE